MQHPLFITFVIVAVITTLHALFGVHSFNISLLLSALFGYNAIKKKKRAPLFIAAFFLFVAFMTMPIVRIILYTALFGVAIYSIVTYTRAQQKTSLTSLHYTQHHKLAQQTDDYRWQDYAVQRAIGNVHIDLTKTILPAETSFISVRHGVGKITVIIPFEIGIRIQASTLIGSTAILDEPRKSFHETVMYEEGLHLQRIVVLHLLSVAGEIEVIRQ